MTASASSREPFHRPWDAAWELHDVAVRALLGVLNAASVCGLDVHLDHGELRELRGAAAKTLDAFDAADAVERGI
jgi:hypothetical protein